MKQFRPIRLCNVSYKILTKALVQRIRPLLDSLINPMQGAFIPGLGQCNSCPGASLFIRRTKRKHGSLAMKIDLAKAGGLAFSPAKSPRFLVS